MENLLKYHKSLKDAIHRNTFLSFLLTIASLGLLFSFNKVFQEEKLVYIPLKKVQKITEYINVFKELKEITKKITSGGDGEIPKIKQVTKDISKSSKIIPIKEDSLLDVIDLVLPPEIELDIDLKSDLAVSDLKNLSYGNGKGNSIGDGSGNKPNFGDKYGDGSKNGIKVPSFKEFVQLDKEVEVDLKDLISKLEYPEFQKRIGNEGTVVVAILIDPNGRVIKHKTVSSENSDFEKEALRVIMNGKYIPGEQNGKKVHSWIRIPIKFKLR
jgi:TonB family protein